MYCKKCGKLNSENIIYCSQCGTQNDVNTQFCKICGMTLNVNNSSQQNNIMLDNFINNLPLIQNMNPSSQKKNNFISNNWCCSNYSNS